jgi:ABC-2 type transport system ATP-binding protein
MKTLTDQATVTAVSVLGLRKAYGEKVVLDGVDLTIGEGEVFALLGPNGAGKTTIVRILSTLIPADAGMVTVMGYDLRRDAAVVRGAIGVTGQFSAVDNLLTGEENLLLMGRLQHLPAADRRVRAVQLLERFDLVEAARQTPATYSGGMTRRLDIAMTLMGRPRLIFLDEPTTGLDPRSRQIMWQLIRDLVAEGVTILLTTQYLEEADELADRIIVIDHGRIIAEGTANELKERTGASFCEIVPRAPKDLPAIAEALGSLLPEKHRAALTPESDRIAMPAPQGTRTLVEAVSRLAAADIEVADLALRRPSLDDVFLALTEDPIESPTAKQPVAGAVS